MTYSERLAKNELAARGRSSGARASTRRAMRPRARKRAKALVSPEGVQQIPLHNMRIADLYRPLKKPVTLRLDADVLAWFKKDGRRYQTRINAALRKVMEREMKQGGLSMA